MEKSTQQTVFFAHPDERMLAEFLKKTRGISAQFRTYTSGKVMLRDAGEANLQLIILNTTLDDGSGLSVIDRIREKKWKEVPFVVLLENDSEELQAKVVKRQVLCKVCPPINMNDIRDIVIRVLQLELEKTV